MISLKKIISFTLSALLGVSLLSGCKVENKPAVQTPTTVPTQSPEDSSANDEPLSNDFVAKIAGEEIYGCEFYYFLYSALREVYYAELENVYDDSLSEEENFKKMLEFLESTAEDGKTYKQKTIERALDIAAGFHVASILGKQACDKNPDDAISQKDIDEVLAYIDSQADYYSSYYSCSRDEYCFYTYGMNVNDFKRYSEAQLYAQKHEELWAKENGYDFNTEEPVEPTKPNEPGENATDEEKEKYLTDSEKYEKELETYKSDLAAYEKASAEYWEKFRGAYEDALNDMDINEYDIVTVRYLYVSTLDDEDKSLSETDKLEKKKEAEKYIELVKEGLDFGKLVKGFSDAETAASDMGLFDINMYSNSALVIPVEAIEWATKTTTPISEDIILYEDDNGYYLVQKVGITDFDKTEGIVADDSETAPGTVRSNVEYKTLANLYNQVVEDAMNTDDFKLTDINQELMSELTDKYLSENDN